MRVIGTAGHVDHGKSTLVRQLTGIDPDRLAEEKAREMTIDLGFAWLPLNDGQVIGVVDVPGHSDFIANMLAGVGGIDAVLLVVAADESVMPQTLEHVAILDLLGVAHGLIVLTKTDLIEDPDWLPLIEEDIRRVLAGTTLAQADLIPVSAHTGTGLHTLVERLTDLLANLPPRPDTDSPRLPVDRVFSISGFGTVVTGTLTGGVLRVGDDLEFQPQGLRGRVRGLQSYNRQVERALPGSRVAVNVAGIDRQEIERGSVLTRPGLLRPTYLTDAHFRHLPSIDRPLKHNAAVKVFVGTAEVNAHVRLLDSEHVRPGAEAWIQLRLDRPLALAQGDRFIVRYPSPAETIGGGVIVDPLPAQRWKRFSQPVIASLETRMQGSPAERLAQAAAGLEPVKPAALQRAVGLDAAMFAQAAEDAVAQGLLLALPDGALFAADSVRRLHNRMLDELSRFHHAEPLRAGMPREALRSRLGVRQQTLALLLDMQAEIVAEGGSVRLAEHQIVFTADQAAHIDVLMSRMAAAPFTPPSYSEAAQMVGEPVLRALIDLERIVQVGTDVIFETAAYHTLVSGVLDMIDAEGSLSTGAFRDRFATTRKYAIALLEHLDAAGITKRQGDNRVRGLHAPPRQG